MREAWINVYEGRKRPSLGASWPSRAKAESAALASAHSVIYRLHVKPKA